MTTSAIFKFPRGSVATTKVRLVFMWMRMTHSCGAGLSVGQLVHLHSLLT